MAVLPTCLFFVRDHGIYSTTVLDCRRCMSSCMLQSVLKYYSTIVPVFSPAVVVSQYNGDADENLIDDT
jgi:hypothetical protein